MSWPKGKHQSESAKEKLRLFHLGRKHTPESIAKIKKARSLQIITEEQKRKISSSLIRIGHKPITLYGSNHPGWKGDEVGIGALHAWVKRNRGIPKKCEYCGSTTAKRFNWANKSWKYKRDLFDWIRLCTKCHHDYDKKFYKESYKKGWETRRLRLVMGQG